MNLGGRTLDLIEHLMACRRGDDVPRSNASAPPLPPEIRDEHSTTTSTHLQRDPWTGDAIRIHEVTPRHGWRGAGGCLRPEGLTWLDTSGR